MEFSFRFSLLLLERKSFTFNNTNNNDRQIIIVNLYWLIVYDIHVFKVLYYDPQNSRKQHKPIIPTRITINILKTETAANV